MLKIYNAFNDNFYLENMDKILDYCFSAFKEKDEPAHINMWSDSWETDGYSLPFVLYRSDRLRDKNGTMFFLLEDDKIIANSGINVSDFDKNVAIGGVRSWVNKEYRGQFIIGKNLLPAQVSWATEKELKTILLTFNEYNRRLIPYFRRSGFGIKKNRKKGSMFFNGQHLLEFPVMINYTKQWVLYHKIDENYEPNWDQIRILE